jgi:hypothetical protein
MGHQIYRPKLMEQIEEHLKPMHISLVKAKMAITILGDLLGDWGVK